MHYLELKKKKQIEKREFKSIDIFIYAQTHTHIQPQLNYNKEHFILLV